MINLTKNERAMLLYLAEAKLAHPARHRDHVAAARLVELGLAEYPTSSQTVRITEAGAKLAEELKTGAS